jgi:hypothetical protein
MRRATSLVAASALAWAGTSACEGTSADEGRDALMQVNGAQFCRGAMPEDASGPKVGGVTLASTLVRVGQVDKPVGGALEPAATAAALSLAGDVGYWIVPAGVPGIDAPMFPSFKALLAFSRALSPGTRDLIVRAVDDAGRFGPATAQPLTLANADTPAGRLVVSLVWDTEADLDLHVIDPNGAEIFNRNINSWAPPPPGQPIDPNAWQSGGILDADSNAECVLDGRRRENVVWTKGPPSGHYVVRVDAFSMCDAVGAHWTVETIADGVSLGRATGAAFDADTRFPHDRGAGVLALEFDRP